MLIGFVRLTGGLILGFVGWMIASEMAIELSLPDAYALGTRVTTTLVFGIAGCLITPHITIYPMKHLSDALSRVSADDLIAGGIGLLIAGIAAATLTIPLSQLPSYIGDISPTFAALALGYFCVRVCVSRQKELLRLLSLDRRRTSGRTDELLLLDTSAIIDGRIADISETGFLPGGLAVPRFVLEELQHVADSPDAQRRARGRRGLELLGRLQQNSVNSVRIIEGDSVGSDGVDTKLVKLAKDTGAAILTNDFNLNRVASIQGVRALNINELANALRAVFLPGEEFTIRLSQEGKEIGQGVGYLDDGTMVVVEDARHQIGLEVEAVVIRVLQTAAGRMVFAHLKGNP